MWESSVSGSELAFFLTDVMQDVPEPGTITIAGIGLVGLAAIRRRRAARFLPSQDLHQDGDFRVAVTVWRPTRFDAANSFGRLRRRQRSEGTPRFIDSRIFRSSHNGLLELLPGPVNRPTLKVDHSQMVTKFG